jgi:hypothetical protein
VGKELFPLLDEGGSASDSIIGISIGFPVAFGIIMYIEHVVGILSDATGGDESEIEVGLDGHEGTVELVKRTNSGGSDSVYNQLVWEEEYVVNSYKAMVQQPGHKEHIQEHCTELLTSALEMETKAKKLAEDVLITNQEYEVISESIDEEIHRFQYKLDHTRRLLQGAETGHSNDSQLW